MNLRHMAKEGGSTLPGDLKATPRAKVTEKLGIEPDLFEEDAEEQGELPAVDERTRRASSR